MGVLFRRAAVGIPLAAVAAALMLAMAWQLRRPPVSHERVYLIGYDHNPPFQIETPGGKLEGIAIDTVRAAARRAGIKLQWVRDKTGMAEILRTGQVDLWPLLTDLPERHSWAHFADPWIVSDNYLITHGHAERRPSKEFEGLIQYSGPKLYVMLANRLWPKAAVQEVTRTEDLAKPFCSGRFNDVFISWHQANTVLRDIALSCPEVEFRAHHLPELTVRLSVASTPQAAAVADRLRTEILKMGEDGELGSILARYVYVGLTETRAVLSMTAAERQSRALVWAVSGLALMFLVLLWLAWRLRRARRQAVLASAAKSEFLANMSHEIRTPLGGVIGMVELALGESASAAQRDQLETAHSSAKSLLAILNDILDFSKIEARRLEIAPVDVDLRALVGDVDRLMGPVARSKGLQFEVSVDSAVPQFVRTDPVRVKQILLNLCGNAVKFTAKGWVRVKLDGASDAADKLRFEVSDTGIGIERGVVTQIFEPFRQADGSTVRKYGGTGLGLAISKQLVTMLGGSIWVDSKPGVGTTFFFTIQYAPAAAPVPGITQAVRAAAAGPLNVLVAEDNRVNQKLILGLLERDGHRVTVAGNGQEAVDAVAGSAPFDLVIMDIQMPVMDGFQATAAIRAMADKRLREIPIIALTAHAQVGYQARCLEAGMNDYLSKPIDSDQLRKLLGAVSAARPRAKAAR